MTPPIVPLAYYCLFLLAASVGGGMLPSLVRLTHRGTQVAVSFVAAMMLGIGMLHMLPHALAEASLAAADASAASSGSGVDPLQNVMLWATAGWLAMFLIERFFSFHHHDFETDARGRLHDHDEHCDHGHEHRHDISWTGAAIGLTLHSVIEGIALAASVFHGHGGLLAGLGAFVVIFLHKPFDSMTIAMLMVRSGRSAAWRHAVNGLFALAIPVGMALFYFVYREASAVEPGGTVLAYALAFSAGTFLCISLSDLLPELQFHDHDRVKLSAALVLGLAVAAGVGRLESLVHRHPPATLREEVTGR